MKKFIELLKEKGIVERIQETVNCVPTTCEGCDETECNNDAIKAILMMECERCDDLDEAFIEGATDMFLDAVVKDLDIKKDPDAKEISIEELMTKALAGIVANIIFN